MHACMRHGMGMAFPHVVAMWPLPLPPCTDSLSLHAFRSGIRALPPRTAFGSVPIAGRILPLSSSGGGSSGDISTSGGAEDNGREGRDGNSSTGGAEGSGQAGRDDGEAVGKGSGRGGGGGGDARERDVGGEGGGDSPPSSSSPRPPSWWVVTGLGARGLVYHAWLGQRVARAVLADSEEPLVGSAGELLGWRDAAAGKGGPPVF